MGHDAALSKKPSNTFGSYRPKSIKGLWLKLCQCMPIRRLALWMRKPLKKSFGEWVDVDLWGLRLRLAPKGNLTEQRLLYMPKHYDTKERAILRDLLSGGGVFLDIGANAGAYSLYLASCGFAGVKIEAFEPDPKLCARFKYNLTENKLIDVCLNEYALGREDGEFVLLANRGNRGQNQVVASGDGISVPIKTLTAVVEEKGIREIKLLKIDVEGHELEVLEPFYENVARGAWPTWIICEYLPGEQNEKCAELILSKGYRLHSRTRMNGIFCLS